MTTLVTNGLEEEVKTTIKTLVEVQINPDHSYPTQTMITKSLRSYQLIDGPWNLFHERKYLKNCWSLLIKDCNNV